MYCLHDGVEVLVESQSPVEGRVVGSLTTLVNSQGNVVSAYPIEINGRLLLVGSSHLRPSRIDTGCFCVFCMPTEKIEEIEIETQAI